VKHGYKVIAPDLLGYGLSDKPQDAAAYSLKRLQHLVLGLLDQLGIARAAVVGHDWGAALAWRLAISAPKRVERLVALSVGHPGNVRSACSARCATDCATSKLVCTTSRLRYIGAPESPL
jgi:pimeloyl-ACP methyl ester carboxylesterase